VEQHRQLRPAPASSSWRPSSGAQGHARRVLAQARADGYVRARIDGVPVDLSERIKLAKTKKHDVEIVVDRLVIPGPGSDESAAASDEIRWTVCCSA
jgi:excinuclease UvrABC ATPase subunit